jgi:D-alanyl-lipoteichoic acid acyltransferase DltB (MBOAT superfamily)
VCGIVFLKSQSFIVVAGFSYLAFRLCYMVAESKSKLIKTITPQDFLDFVFFLPVFSMGPIIRYREFQQQPQLTPSMLDGGFRIIWGILKFKVICLIFKPLTFEVLFFDGYKHGWVDFLLSGFSYLLYLYFNFSGFMDVAIGAGAFVGIKLPENFSSPFASRNMKELWNRWHITLNHFMRDLLFLPFLKFLLKKGSIKQDGSIAISLLFTFILTGLWHGFTMSYFLYGAFHGIGLGIHHFYSKFITKIMGAKLELYLSNPWIKLIATGMTIIYFSISMFFFENSLSQMKDILSNIGSRL